jgi:hypothetical protein
VSWFLQSRGQKTAVSATHFLRSGRNRCSIQKKMSGTIAPRPTLNSKTDMHERTCYIKEVSTTGYDIKLMPTPKVNSWLGWQKFIVNKRPTYLLIKGLSMNTRPTWCLSRLGQNVQAGVDRIFAHFPLKISNVANYKMCVPKKTKNFCIGRFLSV